MCKIAIVGMGRVGAATAFNLGITEVVEQIVAIDYNKLIAQIQVEDLAHAFVVSNSKTKIEVGDYSNLGDVEIVVITAGAPVKKVTSRLNLFDSSLKIITSIVESCQAGGFKGIYLVASNPVDVMTAATYKISQANASKVMGSGTILDNARFRYELGTALNIDYKLITTSTIGEHGESIVPLFDSVEVSGIKLKDYIEANNIALDLEELKKKIVEVGPIIFGVKGATEFGIASSLTKIIQEVVTDSQEVMTVSILKSIEGVGDVYIPYFATVGKDGYKVKTGIKISSVEQKQLIESASILKSYNEHIDK